MWLPTEVEKHDGIIVHLNRNGWLKKGRKILWSGADQIMYEDTIKKAMSSGMEFEIFSGFEIAIERIKAIKINNGELKEIRKQGFWKW
jgi:hypothetical protein